MVTFTIEFASAIPDVQELGAPAMRGRLRTDTEQLTFLAPLNAWARADYERQWKDGCLRLARGHPSSALLTSVQDPSTGDYDAVMFELFVDGDDILICERHLLDAAPWREPSDLYRLVADSPKPDVVSARCSRADVVGFGRAG